MRMITWMFSGLGSQYTGMGRTLFENNERFRRHLVHCDDTAALTFGRSFLDALYGRSSATGTALIDTGLAKAALFSFQYALAHELLERGCIPDRVLGYSLGEFVALTIAGALSLERAMATLAHLERVLASEIGAGNGGMTAVLADQDIVTQHCDWFRDCNVAGVNSVGNFVIGGSIAALTNCESALSGHRVAHQRLAVEYAFHTSAVDRAKDRFLYDLPARFKPVAMPTVLCSDPVPCEVPTMHTLWNAVRAPVNFLSRAEPLCTDPDSLFLDLGPSGTLAGALKGNIGPLRARTLVSPFTSSRLDLEKIVELHSSTSTSKTAF